MWAPSLQQVISSTCSSIGIPDWPCKYTSIGSTPTPPPPPTHTLYLAWGFLTGCLLFQDVNSLRTRVCIHCSISRPKECLPYSGLPIPLYWMNSEWTECTLAAVLATIKFLISVLYTFNQALHFWSSCPRMELLVRWAPPRARLWQEMALSALVPKGGAGRQWWPFWGSSRDQGHWWVIISALGVQRSWAGLRLAGQRLWEAGTVSCPHWWQHGNAWGRRTLGFLFLPPQEAVAIWRSPFSSAHKAHKIDAFELWYWRRLLRVPWTARKSNQSILKEINPEYSLEGLMLKLKLQYFGHLMQRGDSLEKILMLGKIEGRRRRGRERTRWLDGITDSWTWVWANSGSWWWTGKPGVLQFMGSQRVGHDWTTEQQQVKPICHRHSPHTSGKAPFT